METFNQIIREQEHALREKGQLSLNFNKFLAANPPQPQSPHIDLQIQQAVEELRRLKAEHIELRTKELFMKNILTANSLDDLPTSLETGRAEVSLQEAKRDLRNIKAERGHAEHQLNTTVAHLGNSLDHFNQARDEAYLRLRQAREAAKSAHVRDILSRRDISEIESLVEDIDELDASSCREAITILREERALLEREANQKSSAVENLRREVEQLEADVRELNSESIRLKKAIDSENERNSALAKLRHECMLQKELESILTALTGVRVSEIRENGVSFEVNAALLIPFSSGMDRSNATHTVDVEFMDERADQSYVANVSIRPADITVADICNHSGTSLCLVMQTVCSRLAAFKSQRESRSR